MGRVVLGGVLGGIAMWFVGFIFWGTPLSMIALSRTDDASSAALQAALAQHLGPLGTGVYPVPWTGTPAGTALFGQGPTAMVMFNSHGFALPDTASLVGGLILAMICALLVAFAIRAVAGGLSFAGRMTLVALVAVAVTAYSDIGQPIFNHAPWGYFIYLWISDVASWLAAGAVIAWMLPKPAVVVTPA